MKKKIKAKTTKIAPIFQRVLIGAVTYILLFTLVLVGITPEQHDIQVGLPASIDILATKDVNDVVTTEAQRDAAAAAVEPSYKSVDHSVVGIVVADMESLFSTLNSLRQSVTSEQVLAMTDDQFATLSASLPFTITREQLVMLIDTNEDALKTLFSGVISDVREALNSTLPEGQENAAINRISRSLSASGHPSQIVSLITDVMRQCVKPNMLIDEEITEANRQKARDSVEMETCVKGEMIVREGEIVTLAQYMMISSLGLLKEDSIDIPLISGIALIVLLIMSALAFYLYRHAQDKLQPKMLTLLCLIFVLVVALSLALSRWNTYLMPVSLGMLLVALLVDHRLALYMNLALGFTTALFTDATSGLYTMTMFSIMLMSLISGPIVVALFTHRTQRTTTLLAGVLVGISNFLVTFAVGMINSAELPSVSINALWAFSGGMLSAVLCIGFQPLLEWLFNLATNTKLIELSNPNQPLLRRLLIEAPGTYHHSIIVANLAEAAANAIGANGLLARVGAYYHDVGKLKRPMYFKENQMGDNPHDRTDPRVSTAILTAHTRDGMMMAQKERIPGPVLDIIRQHHGDSPVLYFYDKAVKLYGEDTDISGFRYEGPRPRSKEAAAVMLADTIEAAARSIPNPTPDKIDALIRKLVKAKMSDGQLDESELTFRDLERICSAFSTVLTGVFHERIEYPEVIIPPRVDKPESAEAAPAEETSAASAPAGKHEAASSGETQAQAEMSDPSEGQNEPVNAVASDKIPAEAPAAEPAASAIETNPKEDEADAH